ncbi:hypothetical protein [Psychrobacillus sp. PGGUH221]|uniref:hypothetical protein n=1 Tax=Psychrobacillus sp. PGGUH221 TaxID=3020058 RepID=UPI0035C788EF
MFVQNRGYDFQNAYFNYSIVLYWIAAKILGYGKLSLIRVPIYLIYSIESCILL